MPETDDSGVEVFSKWCEGFAAQKARNAVPGEPAAPLINAVLISTTELIDAFLSAQPEQANSRDSLKEFSSEFEPGLDVDKDKWDAATRS